MSAPENLLLVVGGPTAVREHIVSALGVQPAPADATTASPLRWALENKYYTADITVVGCPASAFAGSASALTALARAHAVVFLYDARPAAAAEAASLAVVLPLLRRVSNAGAVDTTLLLALTHDAAAADTATVASLQALSAGRRAALANTAELVQLPVPAAVAALEAAAAAVPEAEAVAAAAAHAAAARAAMRTLYRGETADANATESTAVDAAVDAAADEDEDDGEEDGEGDDYVDEDELRGLARAREVLECCMWPGMVRKQQPARGQRADPGADSALRLGLTAGAAAGVAAGASDDADTVAAPDEAGAAAAAEAGAEADADAAGGDATGTAQGRALTDLDDLGSLDALDAAVAANASGVAAGTADGSTPPRLGPLPPRDPAAAASLEASLGSFEDMLGRVGALRRDAQAGGMSDEDRRARAAEVATALMKMLDLGGEGDENGDGGDDDDDNSEFMKEMASMFGKM